DDIYISIVPFSKDVNIGKDKKDELWLNWSEWDKKNKVCSDSRYKKKEECQDHGGTWSAASHNTWNGCVMDRTQDHDVGNYNPTNTVYDSMVLPEQYQDCPVSILGMTSVKGSKQTLLDKVDSMKPVGNTNQAIGLAWAWLSHSMQGPFPAPS